MSRITIPVTESHTKSPKAQRGDMERCPPALAILEYGFSGAEVGEISVTVETHEGNVCRYSTGPKLLEALNSYDTGGKFPEGVLVADSGRQNMELQTSPKAGKSRGKIAAENARPAQSRTSTTYRTNTSQAKSPQRPGGWTNPCETPIPPK